MGDVIVSSPLKAMAVSHDRTGREGVARGDMLRGRRSGASFESPEGGKVIEHALELLVVESLGQRRDE